MSNKKKQKRKYFRLTLEDRMIIQACINANMSITDIAKRLIVHKSTISREIRRNLVVKAGTDIPCIRRKLGILCNKFFCNRYCEKAKRYYDCFKANEHSSYLQKSSRSKSKLSIGDIQKINEVVSQGVLLGQSLHHIYISNLF
jgi:IS30 family transposase